MFSILIPTLNNFQYLKLCIDSIKKNSRYKNEIIVHSNVGTDKTLEYLNVNKIKFTHIIENSGICKGVNIAAKKATFDYLLYSHDDFYFCPDWDEILNNEVRKIGHNFFYLSGTMVNNGQINFNCGNTIDEFDEKKFFTKL
jgi:glycosyltransferase involved in cell wall biosynthesis